MKYPVLVLLALFIIGGLIGSDIDGVANADFGRHSDINIIGLTPRVGAYWEVEWRTSGVTLLDSWTDGDVNYFKFDVRSRGYIRFREYMGQEKLRTSLYRITVQ